MVWGLNAEFNTKKVWGLNAEFNTLVGVRRFGVNRLQCVST